MKTAIIFSKEDPACPNLYKAFSSHKWPANVSLHQVEQRAVGLEHLDKQISADCFIFASRHSGKGEVKCLCVHTPGNWERAELGGKDRELCIAYPSLQKAIYKELCEVVKGSGYEATMEVTHHGPLIDKPCLFVEIGPSATEWLDIKASEMLASAVHKALSKPIDHSHLRVTIGIGGTHYCSNFNKIELSTDIAFSHMCPKYMLDKLDEVMIRKAFERSSEKAGFAVLDWKGLGKEKQRIIDLLSKMDIRYERTDKF